METEKSATMKKLLGYFKAYKWQSVLGPFFKLLEATFELLVPIVVGLIVDRGLGQAVNGEYLHADRGYIVGMCCLLIAFGLLGFAFSVTAQYFSARTATGVSSDIRKDLFKKMQSLSYKDLDALGTSTMLTRMTSDVNQFQSGVNLALRLFLRSPFIVFGAMITACVVDPASTGIFGATIVALAVVVYAVMWICMPLYKRSQEDLDKVLLSTRENLTGARVLRAFCREEEECAVFEKRNEKLNKGKKFVGVIAGITNPLTLVLVNLASVWLISQGAIRVDGGLLSQGKVIALYNLMGQILIELIKLANLIVTVTKSWACGNRISAVLSMTPSLQTLEGGEAVDEEYAVVFDGVSMKYTEGGDEALEDISFCVRHGETVGIIGATGSGKSTLIQLVPHFYDVSKGEVRVNGRNVQDKDLQTYLRTRIGVVPQKATLFKGTVRENLLWGNASATDEELWQALRLSQAETFIAEKQGLDTPVEQGGKNFSGGQKQRLTVARALVRNPDILILDDASSALDYATDAELRQAVRGLNVTTFIVSQRASSVLHADKIIVLDDGKAVGEGTHDQLMESCAVYREIFESQYEEDAV